jgi:hypothetical protein
VQVLTDQRVNPTDVSRSRVIAAFDRDPNLVAILPVVDCHIDFAQASCYGVRDEIRLCNSCALGGKLTMEQADQILKVIASLWHV